MYEDMIIELVIVIIELGIFIAVLIIGAFVLEVIIPKILSILRVVRGRIISVSWARDYN